MVLDEVRIWHFWNSWIKLTEDCIIKTKHDDLLLYSFPNLQNWFSCHHCMIFCIVQNLQERLAGFDKTDSASWGEIKLYLTAKKYSHDKKKTRIKASCRIPDLFQQHFFLIHTKQKLKSNLFFWTATKTHLHTDCFNPWCPFSLDPSIWACSYVNRQILYLLFTSEHDQAQASCVGSVLDGSLLLVTWCSLSFFLT